MSDDDSARPARAHRADATRRAPGDPVEHLWNAAHEFLAAARAVIDAADAVVIEQQRRAAAPPRRRGCAASMSSSADAPIPTVGLDIGGTKVLGVLLDARRRGRRGAATPLAARGGRRARWRPRPRSSRCWRRSPTAGRCRRGRAGQPRRPRSLLAEPADRASTRRCARRCRTRPEHPIVVDNDANVAARGEIAYGAAVGVAARAARHARHRHRRRRCSSTASCTAARTGSARRSGTSPSSVGGPLCACGEHGHWEAIASGTALGRMARELVGAGRGREHPRRGGRTTATRSPAIHVEQAAARGRRRRDRAAGRATPTTSRSASPGSRTCSTRS